MFVPIVVTGNELSALNVVVQIVMDTVHLRQRSASVVVKHVILRLK